MKLPTTILTLTLAFWTLEESETVYVPSSIESRIIGGWEAVEKQFSFMAALNVETPTTKLFCGGGMLNQLWVITAAICVYEATFITIKLGSPFLEQEDPYRVTVTTDEYYVHPDFDPTTITADIAVVRLLPAVSFTTRILPIHLPANEFLIDDIDVVVLGWGQTSDDDPTLSSTLRYINGTLMSNAECRTVYGNQITDDMACVLGYSNEGTCVGDNGGPIVVHANGRNNVMGVASFISGRGCESGDPSGYTRTWPYIDWLRNVTNIK